ncbi:MAG: WbqC family protein [Endomicrobia bacterium]|nr:WbqC family protein [Endomicrobiia bacterium]
MIVAIHQPHYLPWPGYFNKIIKSDIFVFLDDVQYKKNEWQNRNKIKTATGEMWLTVPVHYKFGQKINEVEIDNKIFWNKDHIKTIKINYQKANFFKDFFPYIENLLSQKYYRLVDINVASVNLILEYLGINKKIITSSSLGVKGEKTLKLVEICKKLSASVYLSGIGAKNYIIVEEFKKNNIEVVFQNYTTPVYPQLFGEFIPNLSIIDMIFNIGKEETIKKISV